MLLLATDASAQGCFNADRWWKVFEIRKAFDGAAAERDAGSIGLVSPGEDSKTYWFLDGGIRTKPCEFYIGRKTAANSPPLVLWYPSVEWHHMSADPLQEEEATNKGGGALNAEVWFGRASSTNLRGYILAKGALKRDALNDTTEKSASVFVSVAQFAPVDVQGGFRPGSPIVYNNFRRAMYFPYVGFEYFRQLAITQSEDVLAPIFGGATAVVRLAFEAYPFHREVIPGNISFVIGGEYNYRRIFEDIPELGTRDLNFLSLAATYYFDTDRNVGLGLTFDKGRSPTTNFVAQQRVVLGLEIKQ